MRATPGFEIAFAALDWTGEMMANPGRMRWFVDHYCKAGGTAEPMDEEDLVQLTRQRLRTEHANFQQARSRGVRHDADDVQYHQQRLDMFHSLRS